MEIEVQNLTFSYGKQPALRKVSFSVQKGTLTAVLGANGAGKSTLFRCLLGFLTPQAGEIRLSGRPLSAYSRREAAEKIAYIPQSSEPIFNYTVLDTVLMGTTGTMNVLQRPGRRQQEAAMQALQRLGIEALAQRGIGTISGGERQLALIARALVQNADILIMDEPTANLDQEAIARLHDQISALKRQGCTIVVAEHRLYFLTDLIDKAFYLRSGVLERAFTGEQFRSLPDPEREALGLRTLTPAVCTLPAVESAGSEEGLSVEGLTCSFRKGAPVFRNLSFSARPGEVVAITGPNGVGKTTLSRCLCGLLKEQAGQILLNGKPLDRKGRQRSAFCVMQDVNHQLFSDSVWGECRMSAPEASDDQISEVLDSLHLLPFRERHPMSLSGGQKQRLAVATALLSEKPMLIFDEPTSGLDYARMVEVSGVIRSLARHERIVLVVTHDQEFMQRACDRVLRL